MVQFQMIKKENSLPSKNLNSSLRNSQKNLPQHLIINQQILNRIQSKQLEKCPKKTNNQFSLTARFGVTQPNFRKTSTSFQKKFYDDEDDLFRKTTLSMKNIAKKNSFFDDIISDENTIQRYKIIGQIGKGSFSIVSSAFDKVSNRHVAVKIYQKINSLGWHRLESIKKQIQSLKKLSHQNIVELYHIAKQKNKLMIFMQNCGKQTLAGLMRKSKIFDQNLAKKLFYEIIQGVKHIHSKGICHRDLKPENILINENGNAKIIDFGFSSSSKGYLTTYCGTSPFMCPQIVQKRPYNGIKADIWALGVILFLMLNGKLPFKATTEEQLYRLIQAGKVTFSQNCKNQSAKKLILKMLKVQQQERITADQIINEKWLKSMN